MPAPLFRIGLGQDSHPLLDAAPGQSLHLAGLAFDCGLTFAAHSNGDVIIHALCNALSTALGGGSLSSITDPLCAQGITDSRQYLAPFLQQITNQNYHLANVSLAIEALQPQLEKYRPAMTNSLAKLLDLDPSLIGIAFTSGENLTQFGQGEGIACLASILLQHD